MSIYVQKIGIDYTRVFKSTNPRCPTIYYELFTNITGTLVPLDSEFMWMNSTTY